jgi:hypothetical protein
MKCSTCDGSGWVTTTWADGTGPQREPCEDCSKRIVFRALVYVAAYQDRHNPTLGGERRLIRARNDLFEVLEAT